MVSKRLFALLRKELADVHVQHPFVLEATLTRRLDGIVPRPRRAVTVGVAVEDGFQTRSDLHHNRLLGYPVENGRYAQRAFPAVRLRYLHLQHGLGHVAATAHAIPKLVEVILHALVEPLEVNLVHTRAPLVALDCLVRFPYPVLVNNKRFRRVLCLLLTSHC